MHVEVTEHGLVRCRDSTPGPGARAGVTLRRAAYDEACLVSAASSRLKRSESSRNVMWPARSYHAG
jgi:hypothetical protein